MSEDNGGASSSEPWAIGIEEEYLLFDADGGGLRSDSEAVRAAVAARTGTEIDPELLQSQVEVATGVHATIDAAGAELGELRRTVAAGAEAAGCRLVAAGSHPTARWRDQQVTDRERYHGLADTGGPVARETMVCGLH
ncbi:MAG TPA: glutamate-cysteine ligase family protein, partial [Acidimicrobiales bacterium]|nr:glutamate-cysteine ligase family protein [Acidimicrobiales bacterium]